MITDLEARRIAREIHDRFYSIACKEGIVEVVMGALRGARIIDEADCMKVIALFNRGIPPAMENTKPARSPVVPAATGKRRKRRGRGARAA